MQGKHLIPLPLQLQSRKLCALMRGVAQPGRALPSGGRGREFKSRHPDHLACGYTRKSSGLTATQTILFCTSTYKRCRYTRKLPGRAETQTIFFVRPCTCRVVIHANQVVAQRHKQSFLISFSNLIQHQRPAA